MPACPVELEKEIDKRGAWLAMLRSEESADTWINTTIDRLLAEIDDLTRAYIVAYHNETG